jgi:hypothetical protein
MLVMAAAAGDVAVIVALCILAALLALWRINHDRRR